MYIIVLVWQGLLWREVLEFRDGVPSRRHRSSREQPTQGHEDPSAIRFSQFGAGVNFNRMVYAFTRQAHGTLKSHVAPHKYSTPAPLESKLLKIRPNTFAYESMQVRVLRYVELPGHVDDLLHLGRLHLPDDSIERRKFQPLLRPVLLCAERPSPLLEAAGAVADRCYARTDDTSMPNTSCMYTSRRPCSRRLDHTCRAAHLCDTRCWLLGSSCDRISFRG